MGKGCFVQALLCVASWWRLIVHSITQDTGLGELDRILCSYVMYGVDFCCSPENSAVYQVFPSSKVIYNLLEKRQTSLSACLHMGI